MDLPRRPKGDEYTRPGRYGELQAQLHRRLTGRDIPVLFVYAFDYRTRLGPFLFCDKMLVPGAPTAVGAALHAAGFTNTRLVLQQWTPNVRPSRSRLDGRLPEVLLVSSMQIHSAAAYELIRDAWTLNDHRPLILAGGLTPEHVAEAIGIVRPYAVDVASGVESQPGRKDVEKMRRFIDNVRNSETE